MKIITAIKTAFTNFQVWCRETKAHMDAQPKHNHIYTLAQLQTMPDIGIVHFEYTEENRMKSMAAFLPNLDELIEKFGADSKWRHWTGSWGGESEFLFEGYDAE